MITNHLKIVNNNMYYVEISSIFIICIYISKSSLRYQRLLPDLTESEMSECSDNEAAVLYGGRNGGRGSVVNLPSMGLADLDDLAVVDTDFFDFTDSELQQQPMDYAATPSIGCNYGNNDNNNNENGGNTNFNDTKKTNNDYGNTKYNRNTNYNTHRNTKKHYTNSFANDQEFKNATYSNTHYNTYNNTNKDYVNHNFNNTNYSNPNSNNPNLSNPTYTMNNNITKYPNHGTTQNHNAAYECDEMTDIDVTTIPGQFATGHR